MKNKSENIIFALVLLGLSIWIGHVWVYTPVTKVKEIRASWVLTPAKVLSYEKAQVPRTKHSVHTVSRIRYEYLIAGQLYQSSMVCPNREIYLDKNTYAVGNTVMCRVNPKAKGEAVLEPGTGKVNVIYLGLSIGLFATSIGLFVNFIYAIIKRKNNN